MSFSNVLLYSRLGGEGFVPERDLCQRYPKHLGSGMIGTVLVGFMKLMAEVLGRFSREQHYLCLGLNLRERPFLVAILAIILPWSSVPKYTAFSFRGFGASALPPQKLLLRPFLANRILQSVHTEVQG